LFLGIVFLLPCEQLLPTESVSEDSQGFVVVRGGIVNPMAGMDLDFRLPSNGKKMNELGRKKTHCSSGVV
jgi:hypothetical protein